MEYGPFGLKMGSTPRNFLSPDTSQFMVLNLVANPHANGDAATVVLSCCINIVKIRMFLTEMGQMWWTVLASCWTCTMWFKFLIIFQLQLLLQLANIFVVTLFIFQLP